MSDQEIHVPSKLRKYFTMLPNLYDDSGLDPYEFRLLAHYVRVGDCWEALKTTAAHCCMSRRAAIAKRDQLAAKGFITLGEHKRTETVTIEVVDLWDKNFAKYASASGAPTSARPAYASASGAPKLVHQVHTKNNHKKQNPLREKYRGHPSNAPKNGRSRKTNIQGSFAAMVLNARTKP